MAAATICKDTVNTHTHPVVFMLQEVEAEAQELQHSEIDRWCSTALLLQS